MQCSIWTLVKVILVVVFPYLSRFCFVKRTHYGESCVERQEVKLPIAGRPASACARKSPPRGCTLKKQDKTRQVQGKKQDKTRQDKKRAETRAKAQAILSQLSVMKFVL